MIKVFIVIALFFTSGCAYQSLNKMHIKAEKASYGLISITNGTMDIIRTTCTKEVDCAQFTSITNGEGDYTKQGGLNGANY